MFTKRFQDLNSGFKEMKRVSFSVTDAVADSSDVESAIRVLACNTLFPTSGNGVGWELPLLEATPRGVQYTTTGGLSFGWRAAFWGPIGSANTEFAGWDFFVKHPNGVAPKDSTLRASALEHGWVEVQRLETQFFVV